MLKTNNIKNKLSNFEDMRQIELTFNSNEDLNLLLGKNSKNLEKLNEALNVKINFFGNKLIIIGKKNWYVI